MRTSKAIRSTSSIQIELVRRPFPYGLASALTLCLVTTLAACSREPVEVPIIENEEQLLVMLKRNDFENVSGYLTALHRKYRAQPEVESDVHKAWYAFYRTDRSLEAPLNAWVRSASDDPYPYLARGIYRTRLGWERRGNAYASDTSARDARGMGYWFKLAKTDLHQAVSLDHSQIEAYLFLMEIEMNEGGDESPLLFSKALEINPLSLFARWYYMTTLLPRWGGSHDAIREVVASSRAYYGKNPRLEVLEGRVDGDLADQKFFAKDYSGAKAKYDEALRHGNFWFYNQQKGECLYQLADPVSAVEQFTTVIAEKPGYKRAYWMSGPKPQGAERL